MKNLKIKNRFLAAAALVMALLLAGCASGNVQQNPSAGGQNAPVSAVTDGQGADVVPIEDISGSWYDLSSRRAWLEVDGVGDGIYNFLVHWSSSAAEYTEWESTGTYNAATGEYEYTGGVKRDVAYMDEDSEPEINVLYSDSTGSFALLTDRIVWNDTKDPETASGRVFIRSDADIPTDLDMIGFYMADDESTIEIEYYDGIILDMSIIRLAEFKGRGVYDSGEKALIADVTDPNGNPMVLKIYKNNDTTVTVEVVTSVWDLLPTGESFVFN